MKNQEEFDTLRCWNCYGSGWIIKTTVPRNPAKQRGACPKCDGTGCLFWVGGYAYPYTPQGEKRAREDEKRRR